MKKQHSVPSVAEFYHQQTNYSPENLSTFVPDVSSRPDPFREYLSERAVRLKPYLGGVPEGGGQGPDEGEKAGGLVARLGRLLFHTGGITRVLETDDGPRYFRAAPSAGALYPTELYLASRGVEGLRDGIHAFSVLSQELVPLWEGDFGMDIEELCFRHAGAVRAQAVLLFTGVFQKSAWRYRERAYRRILLDTGHALANAALYAPKEGFRLATVAGFYDSAFNDLLFLNSREEALLVAAPIIEAEGLESTRINSPFPFPSPKHDYDSARVSGDGVMRLLHRRSEIVPNESLLSRVPTGPFEPVEFLRQEKSLERHRLPRQGSSISGDLSRLIRRRRSTRSFRRQSLEVGNLARILEYAYEPATRYLEASAGLALSRCVMADPSLLKTYVVVLRVEGLEPGVYVYDDSGHSLLLKRAGDFENDLHSACLFQNLGRDCAAAIIHTTNLGAAVERYGDRAYRYVHLDAGHLGQRINLSAVDLGVGVSGIGGFFDAEVNALLGHRDPWITLYITALGTA